MGVDRSAVIAMIPTLFLPFNVAKALLNTSITMLLYKPISLTLRRMHLLGQGATKEVNADPKAQMRFGSVTLWIVLIALIAATISVLMFIRLNAKIN